MTIGSGNRASKSTRQELSPSLVQGSLLDFRYVDRATRRKLPVALEATQQLGYFGGAIATHLRAGSPVFTHALFPIYMAVLLWAGLWLRDGRLRRIVSAVFRPAP